MRSKAPLAILNVALASLMIYLVSAPAALAADYKVLYQFRGDVYQDGRSPFAGLIFDSAGNLYGTTTYGGLSVGTVFRLSPNPDGQWSEAVIHNFSYWEGMYPLGGVLMDSAGNLYATTQEGGTGFECDNGCGAVVELTPNPDGTWSGTNIYSFRAGDDGYFPNAAVVSDAAGNLYGTTLHGGIADSGTVFKLTRQPGGSWNERVLHAFKAGRDGAYPAGDLVSDAAGNLYGTTVGGGNTDCGGYGCGTVFRLHRRPDGTWSERVIARFHGISGAEPLGALIFDAAGNLYGTTSGAARTNGTVFKLSPNPDGTWTKSTLHAFQGGADGMWPQAGLIFDSAGNLYGTTWAGGGPSNGGTVFELTPQPDGKWTLTSLHMFDDLNRPAAPLIMDAAGTLYGTASEGGPYPCFDCGLVFSIKP